MELISIAVSENFHVEVREGLMAAVILRANKTIELAVIQIH